MAKFLFATMPITGHVNPVVPIASELVHRGHDVRWYTGRRFQPKIEAAGATYVPMKAAVDFDEGDVEAYFPKRKGLKGIAGLKFDFKHIFIDSAIGQNQDLTEILRDSTADVILSEIVFLGSTLFAPTDRPLSAGVGLFPLGISSSDTAPFGPGIPPNASSIGRVRNLFLNWMTHQVMFRDVQAYANGQREKMGLPSLKQFFLDAACNMFSIYLQGTTPAFEYQRSDMPDHIHFIGPLLPKSHDAFSQPSWWDDLKSDPTVILVTQGTVATDYNKLMLPTIQVLADENVLVVATTGNPVEHLKLIHPPDNLRLEQFIPYDKLLPHVDVMITNAGYGGIQFALSYGVPLVVAGQTEEKAEICARVDWAGVGINLKTDSPKPQQIKKAVKKVLADTKYKQRARQIQYDFARYHAPTKAAELLEELAEKKQPILR
ncbi:MAG: glycosyltransferase [bacterium]